jgi:hypothetical protein
MPETADARQKSRTETAWIRRGACVRYLPPREQWDATSVFQAGNVNPWWNVGVSENRDVALHCDRPWPKTHSKFNLSANKLHAVNRRRRCAEIWVAFNGENSSTGWMLYSSAMLLNAGKIKVASPSLILLVPGAANLSHAYRYEWVLFSTLIQLASVPLRWGPRSCLAAHRWDTSTWICWPLHLARSTNDISQSDSFSTPRSLIVHTVYLTWHHRWWWLTTENNVVTSLKEVYSLA